MRNLVWLNSWSNCTEMFEKIVYDKNFSCWIQIYLFWLNKFIYFDWIKIYLISWQNKIKWYILLNTNSFWLNKNIGDIILKRASSKTVISGTGATEQRIAGEALTEAQRIIPEHHERVRITTGHHAALIYLMIYSFFQSGL